ncbi:hypothetical protein ABZW18_15015 [Streptomyces sp. NPDC004647]|uniref:hypothetical protein n=1 Tax=Streptomyces sp. NPDC004647 TaxID=3154671 RepID=UPI0033B10A6D
MDAGWGCRAVRAAVFAAVCVLLAALGHVMMSGAGVPWWALATGALATVATAWCLTGRERGRLPVVSIVVAVQAALHSAFSLAQAAVRPVLPDSASFAQQWAHYVLCGASDTASLSSTRAQSMAATAGIGSRLHEPGMDHASMNGRGGHALQAAMDGTSMPMGDGMDGMPPAGMLAAHLLAALLCGLWLAHGERAAFRILRAFTGWLLAPLRLLFRLPTPPHRPRVRGRYRAVRAPQRLLLVHAITSRGPPAGIAVI